MYFHPVPHLPIYVRRIAKQGCIAAPLHPFHLKPQRTRLSTFSRHTPIRVDAMHPRSSPPISLFVFAGADGANSPRCRWPPMYPAGVPLRVRKQAQAAHNNSAPLLLRIILHAIPCTHRNAPYMRPYIPRIPPTDSAHKSAPALLLLSLIPRIDSTRNTRTPPLLHGITHTPHIPPHKASRRATDTPQPVQPTHAAHRQTSASMAHVISLQLLRAFLLVFLRATQREPPTRYTLTGSQPTPHIVPDIRSRSAQPARQAQPGAPQQIAHSQYSQRSQRRRCANCARIRRSSCA